MDLKLVELHILNQIEGIYVYIERKNVAVYRSLEWQVMETQEVLCPRGSRAQGRSNPKQRREKGHKDGISY